MAETDDLKLLALLVHRGQLERAAAEKLFADSRSTGRRPLDLAVSQGLFTRERLDLLRRMEGEDVPELPGLDLIAIAGRGGTAVVVQAQEKKSGRDFAVKVLRREFETDAKIKASFLREAKLLTALRHPNVVAGEKVGTVNGRLVFLMEFVPGRSLQDHLRDGTTFDEDQALYIVLQVARALQYLAEEGVVHRDVKPGNVLVTSRNEVKLIDLGFAGSTSGTAPSDSGAASGDDKSGAASSDDKSGAASSDDKSGAASSDDKSGAASSDDKSGAASSDDKSGAASSDDKSGAASSDDKSGAASSDDKSGAASSDDKSGAASSDDKSGAASSDDKSGAASSDDKSGAASSDDKSGAASSDDKSGAASSSETTVGTAAYISPEQARGQSDLDVRSDIYSLGATLYQLVAGELPFTGQDNQEVIAAQILASLSSEVLKSRRISPHMHYFIEKMMAKEREVRYQSPAELIADIEQQIRGKKTLEFQPGARPDDELLKKPFAAPPPAPPSSRTPTNFRRRRPR